METPSSTRRVTRSQTLAASNGIPNSRKKEESEKALSRSRKGKSDRSALVEITNDSPIVGLAAGSLKTPNSLAKNGGRAKQTPGSGEALLRCQVKTLLQKVEEEAELLKFSFDGRPFLSFQGTSDSPALRILAPTPANTPIISNPLNGGEGDVVPISSVTLEAKGDYQMTEIVLPINGSKEETLESHEGILITRALLFDSPGKSEQSISSASSVVSSAVTYEEGCHRQKLLEEEEEDDASAWSVLANASSKGEVDEVEEEEEDYNERGEEAVDGELIDELCKGLRLMCVEEKRGLPEFSGKHTRFIYNSDDEIEGEEVIVGPSVSPSVLQLKGLPLPEGKHLRFPEEAAEEEEK